VGYVGNTEGGCDSCAEVGTVFHVGFVFGGASVTCCGAEGDCFCHECFEFSFVASVGGCVTSEGFAWVGGFFLGYVYFGGVSAVGQFCVYWCLCLLVFAVAVPSGFQRHVRM
jgi:hypothetical protein